MKAVVISIVCLMISINLSFGQEVITKKFERSNYDRVKLSCPIDLKIVADGKEGVAVKCDERLINAFEIENTDGELTINFDTKALKHKNFKRGNFQLGDNKTMINGISYKGGVKMIVHVKNISKISASRSGDIVWEGSLPSKNLTLTASSSGDISWTGMLETESLTVKASSSGDIEGNYKGKSAIVSLSSSGDYEGDFNVETLNMQLSSSGDYKGKVNALTATFRLSSSSDAKVSGSINSLDVKAGSSADFHGKDIVYKKAVAETHSSANIYLSKSGELIDNTPKRTGVIVE